MTKEVADITNHAVPSQHRSGVLQVLLLFLITKTVISSIPSISALEFFVGHRSERHTLVRHDQFCHSRMFLKSSHVCI